MILLKDYKTNKKSITVTFLAITFLVAVASLIVNLMCLANQQPTDSGLVWAGVGLCSPFVGIYWNKRIRASANGIEIEKEVDNG